MAGAKGLIDLGDGLVVGATNSEGRCSISDKATGTTLGWAGGDTPAALERDIQVKVGRIRARRAAAVAKQESVDRDWASARDKAIAALRAKGVQAEVKEADNG